MQQLSAGRFLAKLEFAQVNGILLTHERWSKRIFATGATPRDYVALAGICADREFLYCGASIGEQVVSCGLDGTDVEFVTQDGADHWVILVPVDMLTNHLGEEVAADLLPKGRSLTSEPRLVRQLGSLVVSIVTQLRDNSSYCTDCLLLGVLQSQLLAAVTEFLACSDNEGKLVTARKRYLACRRALSYAETLRQPISVCDLALLAGVSRRTLQIGFRELLDMSPQRFLRHIRLNGMHRDLRRAIRGRDTVTEIAGQWGFQELGRIAAEYRHLFDENPSATLARHTPLYGRRYGDLLAIPAGNAES